MGAINHQKWCGFTWFTCHLRDGKSTRLAKRNGEHTTRAARFMRRARYSLGAERTAQVRFFQEVAWNISIKPVQIPSPKGSPVPNKPQIHANPRERTHGYGPMGQKVHPQLIITSQRFKLVLRRYPISLMNPHMCKNTAILIKPRKNTCMYVYIWCVYICVCVWYVVYIWANYNNSQTWIKTIWDDSPY